MERYGWWDDRERRGSDEPGERERRRPYEPWRGEQSSREEWRGEPSRREEWRGGEPWRREESRGGEPWRREESRGGEPWRREEWRGEPYRRDEWRGEPSSREQRWGGYESERHARPEIDPPWVERGPDARRRGETRGLVEWEDRGPLEWLGKKVREATGRAGRGPKGYQRSDERIREDVCERIARAGVDADEVEVSVENREVTLSGTVRSRREKWWLEDLADDVFGVEDIHNHLHVRREGESERSPEPPGRTEPH